MARETRKRTASARDADDAPAEERRGRASAGPSGSARDAKAVKREKAQKGKAPVGEAVIDLDEEEDDDLFELPSLAGGARDDDAMAPPSPKAVDKSKRKVTWRANVDL